MTRSHTWLVGVAIVAFAYALLGNYVALPGYLRFLERGGTSAAGNTLDMAVILGAARTILWMYAFNLGAMSLYLFALARQRSPYLRRGILLCIVWLGFWSVPVLPKMPPVFYVVLGSAILVAIVLAHVRRANITPALAAFLSAAVLRHGHLGCLRPRQHRTDSASGGSGARSVPGAAQRPDHQADDRPGHRLDLLCRLTGSPAGSVRRQLGTRDFRSAPQAPHRPRPA